MGGEVDVRDGDGWTVFETFSDVTPGALSVFKNDITGRDCGAVTEDNPVVVSIGDVDDWQDAWPVTDDKAIVRYVLELIVLVRDEQHEDSVVGMVAPKQINNLLGTSVRIEVLSKRNGRVIVADAVPDVSVVKVGYVEAGGYGLDKAVVVSPS